MRKLTFLCSLMVVLSLLAVTPVMANTLSLTNLPVFTYNGYYVGPATGNLNGGTSFSLVCDDFTHTTYIPSSFGVNVSTIPELQNAMYATQPTLSGQVDNYKWASLLLWQMGLTANQSASEIGGLNYAIWNIFNPSVADPGTSNYWVGWAQSQDLSAFDFSGVRIYTPSNTQNQEFIGGAASPVPEPMTFALIGTGLVGLGLIRRRRKTTNSKQ